MSDATESTKSGNRSSSFPVLSLPEAATIVKKAGTYGKAHSPTALAGYAGHTSATSGPWRQKAAALREWGFITSGTGDSVSLTDRAMSIAHPETTEKAQAALLEAFKGSSLFMRFYGDFAKNSELELAGIASKAVNGHGISVAAKDKFTKSFVDSAVAVGLAERVGTDRVKILPMPSGSEGDAPDPDRLDGDQDENEGPGDETPIKRRRRTGAPVIDQTWEIDDGTITFSITSNKPLAAALYTKIAEVITAIEGVASEIGSSEGDDTGNGTAQ